MTFEHVFTIGLVQLLLPVIPIVAIGTTIICGLIAATMVERSDDYRIPLFLGILSALNHTAVLAQLPPSAQYLATHGHISWLHYWLILTTLTLPLLLGVYLANRYWKRTAPCR